MLVGAAAATHYHFDHVGGVPPPPFDAMGIKPRASAISSSAAASPRCVTPRTARGDREERRRFCAAAAKTSSPSPATAATLLARGRRVRATALHTARALARVTGRVHRRRTEGAPGNGAGVVIGGDTIFPGRAVGSTSRTRASLQRHVRLAGEVREASSGTTRHVYPGHDYNGASSTVAREKRRACSDRHEDAVDGHARR